ncbi:MAG: ATP-binding protein [Candidatus Omnitrophica bacterium]|nr:ATP-binding protein [Candidatus Omnitrophota bacterium]
MKKNTIKIIAGLLIIIFLPFGTSFADVGQSKCLSPVININNQEMVNVFLLNNLPRIISARGIGQFSPEAKFGENHKRIKFGDTFYAYGTLKLDRELSKADVENLFSQEMLRMGVWTSSLAKRGDKVKVVEMQKDGKKLWVRPWIELKQKKTIIDIAVAIKKAAKELTERHIAVNADNLRQHLLGIIKTPMLLDEELSELVQTLAQTVKAEDLKNITADEIISLMQKAFAYKGQLGNEFRLECEIIPLEIPTYPDNPERNGIMEFSVYFNPRNPQSSDDFHYTTKWKNNSVMEIVLLGDFILSLEQRRDFYEHLCEKYLDGSNQQERSEILGVLLFYAVDQKDEFVKKILVDKIIYKSPEIKKQIITDLAAFNMDDIMPFLTPLLIDSDQSVFELAMRTLNNVRKKQDQLKPESKGDRQHLMLSRSEMAFDFLRQKYIDMSAGKERIKYLLTLINHSWVKKNRKARKILNEICQHPDPEVRKRFAEDLEDFEAKEISGFLYQLLNDKNSDVSAAAQHAYWQLEKTLYIKGLTHHIRNKITSIGGFARLIVRKLAKEEGKDKKTQLSVEIIAGIFDKMEQRIFRETQYIAALSDDITINAAVDSLLSEMSQPIKEIKETMRQLNADIKNLKLGTIEEYIKRMNTEFNIISEMMDNLKKTIGIEQLELSLKKVELNDFLLKCRDNFKREFKVENIIKRELNGLSFSSGKDILAEIIKEQLANIPLGTREITRSAVAIITKARTAGVKGSGLDMLKIKTLLERVIAAREIDIEFISTGSPVETIVSDEFEKIIKEMLANAVNAYAKKITIRIDSKSLDKVEVSIADNGTGMGVYEKLFAFSPFFTTEIYTKSFTLRRIKQVLNSYGGKISLFSEKSGILKGTKFVIELPSVAGNEIKVGEIIRLKHKLQTVLLQIDQWLAVNDIPENFLDVDQKSADIKIMNNFRQNANNLLMLIETYERGDMPFDAIMKSLRRQRGDFITQYGILEEIGEEEKDTINLKNNAAEVLDIFLGILVSAFRSTENCSIVEEINEIADFYRPQFKALQGDITLDFSAIEKAGLKENKVFLPKIALRKILGDFLFAAHDRKIKNVFINVSVDNRQLKVETNIQEKTEFDANRFLLRQKENVDSANGLAKTAVLPDGGLVFSLWLPIKADIKILPCRKFNFASHPIIVVSGDAGVKRGQSIDYLAAVLGGKTENVGFLMRVVAYYLIKEHPEWVAEFNQLADEKNGEAELNKLIEDKIVPYVAYFLGAQARVKMVKDPWMIRDDSGVWIDSAASGKRGQPSLRNRIKEETNREEHMRFFYVLSNHPKIKSIVEPFSFEDGLKAIKEATANCVIIKSTDLWSSDLAWQDQPGFKIINVFLHAPLAERVKNLIYWDGEDISLRDGLKPGTDSFTVRAEQEADISLLVTNKTGRQIGDILIGYLISSGIILPSEIEQNHLSVKAEYDKLGDLFLERSI